MTIDVPHYWTADQVARLLDTLAERNRHQARALALEWRDLDYRLEVPTLLVRESKSGKPRAVPLHGELVQLFANWPAKPSPRDRVVALTMRTALRHIGDGIRWAGLDEESPQVRANSWPAPTVCGIRPLGTG